DQRHQPDLLSGDCAADRLRRRARVRRRARARAGGVTAAPTAPRAWQGEAFDAALEAALHTPRLRLEPQRPEHADALFAPLGDARLYEHIPQEPPSSLEALRERLTRLATRRSPTGDELWLNWVVRDAHHAALLGRVQATVRADAPCYVAYEVFPDHWQRGIATEACRRMRS